MTNIPGFTASFSNAGHPNPADCANGTCTLCYPPTTLVVDIPPHHELVCGNGYTFTNNTTHPAKVAVGTGVKWVITPLPKPITMAAPILTWTSTEITQEEPEPELHVGTLLGLRYFDTHSGKLTSVNHGWHHYEPGWNTAECRKANQHDAPHMWCQCGFYACPDVDTLRVAWDRHYDHITGVVELQGKVIIHDNQAELDAGTEYDFRFGQLPNRARPRKGYRAAKMRVVALCFEHDPWPYGSMREANLKHNYPGVPIYGGADWELFLEHLHP